jgi:hypothetical protein
MGWVWLVRTYIRLGVVDPQKPPKPPIEGTERQSTLNVQPSTEATIADHQGLKSFAVATLPEQLEKKLYQ